MNDNNGRHYVTRTTKENTHPINSPKSYYFALHGVSLLAKQLLLLSVWHPWRDSNPRPATWKASILTAEPTAQACIYAVSQIQVFKTANHHDT